MVDSTNKNAHPAVGAAERATDLETFSRATISNSNFNMTTSDRQGSISSLLLAGSENGLHLSDLVRITGWTEREIRRSIHLERRNGKPILSNNKDGYFLPGNDAERTMCVRSLRHRAEMILRAAAAIEGQVTM